MESEFCPKTPAAELAFCKLLAYCGWLDEAWRKRDSGF